MKFGCLEPSKIMFDICDLGLVFVVVLCFRLFRICVFVRFVFVLKAVRIAARVVYERAFVDVGDFGFVFFYVFFYVLFILFRVLCKSLGLLLWLYVRGLL